MSRAYWEASRLAEFPDLMAERKLEIFSISVQNEWAIMRPLVSNSFMTTSVPVDDVRTATGESHSSSAETHHAGSAHGESHVVADLITAQT